MHEGISDGMKWVTEDKGDEVNGYRVADVNEKTSVSGESEKSFMDLKGECWVETNGVLV